MGSQDGLRPLLWGRPALMPQECTILCLLNKTLRCNWAVTLVHHFKSFLRQDRTGNYTLFQQLDGITDSMDLSLSKLWEIVKDREAWRPVVHDTVKSWTRLRDWIATKPGWKPGILAIRPTKARGQKLVFPGSLPQWKMHLSLRQTVNVAIIQSLFLET